jgi:hypothetical protein
LLPLPRISFMCWQRQGNVMSVAQWAGARIEARWRHTVLPTSRPFFCLHK